MVSRGTRRVGEELVLLIASIFARFELNKVDIC